MRPFTYDPAATLADANTAARGAREAPSRTDAPVQYLAGGTTMLDLMKLDVLRPSRLVDIKKIAEAHDLSTITASSAGLRIGALVKMSQAAGHDVIRREYPVIAESLVLAASAQLRNMATLGGNVLQRTRCNYFRDTSYDACNKRNPGSGCAALEGYNRLHAVLGTSDRCIATYPGDFAQALVALEASVEIMGARGQRKIAFTDLHHEAGATPEIETSLEPGDVITAFDVPAQPWTRRSVYLKIRDRESYEFALASAAVALDLDGGTVRNARVALGGVATKPWRSREAEAAIVGKRLDAESAEAAGAAAFAAAHARDFNSYKIALGRQTVARALLQAAALEI